MPPPSPLLPKCIHYAATLCRQLSSLAATTTTTTTTNANTLTKIPLKYREKAIKVAQKALTDYLHSTRSLPYTYAEHISKHSHICLSNLMSRIEFSVTGFPSSLRKFLRYHPINEFEFFYESIGIGYSDVGGFLPTNKFFFSEDVNLLAVAGALCSFGFPWNKLGLVYKEESSVFGVGSEELLARLRGFKDRYGFDTVTIIGICLAFPHVLSEVNVKVSALLDDLKRVFVDFGLESCVVANAEALNEVCRKIRVFYDLGCEEGRTGELMGMNKTVFIDYPIEVLLQKVEYFCQFGVRKEDVGLFLLQRPEIFSFNLESRVISVEALLRHCGLKSENLHSVSQKYAHVMGSNDLVNLPNVMRAIGLHVWFFERLKDGNHQLLGNATTTNPFEGLTEEFRDFLNKIQLSRTPVHSMNKLNFVKSIGFGENNLTIKVLANLHGSSSELQERFDCLIRIGIEFSKVCSMVAAHPKTLNQKPESLEKKINYLCQDMGGSLEFLDRFPAFLCFHLEKRIIPRYSCHMWLKEKGVCLKEYSFASIVATSEKAFVHRLSSFHPATPKHYFERFLPQQHLLDEVW